MAFFCIIRRNGLKAIMNTFPSDNHENVWGITIVSTNTIKNKMERTVFFFFLNWLSCLPRDYINLATKRKNTINLFRSF